MNYYYEPLCMDVFTIHLLNDNEEDFLVTAEYISLRHKIYIIRRLNDCLRMCDSENTYFRWLLLLHGDLEGRETRKISWLDECQIRQVYDYITIVLGIRLPPFDIKRADSNNHLWRFFQSIHSKVYRDSSDPEVDTYLKQEWNNFDMKRAEIRANFLTKERDSIEDCYYIRGKWVAYNEILVIQKAIAETRPFYNIIRGKGRFDKLFHYHGQRTELIEYFDQWKKLVYEYGPDYLLNQKTRTDAPVDLVREGRKFFEEWMLTNNTDETLVKKYNEFIVVNVI